MKTINQKTELALKIALLKQQQSEDFKVLQQQYHSTIDSFKPLNLIKSASQLSAPSSSYL